MKKLNSTKIALVALTFIVVLIGCLQLEDQQLDNLANEQPVNALDAPVISYGSQAISGQYIIVLKADAVTSRINLMEKDYPGRQQAMQQEASDVMARNNVSSGKISHVYGSSIIGFAVTELNDKDLAILSQDPMIEYIEQDQVISLQMGGPPGGGGGDDPQTTPWGITRVGGSVDGTGKRAWILDSGIDMDHPDLNVNAGLSQSFLVGGPPSNSSPEDKHGHGTHVAGTVAAIDNGIGVVGVAANAEVVAVRVLDSRGSGSTSGVIAGVNYVGANAANADAANMSLTGGASPILDNAVVAASNQCNCTFALAAGNDSGDANNYSPARANGSNILTVSASDINDNWAYFSNYGNPPVDYCAPGVSVNSTWKDGGYNTISGTSMATPHVCGLALLGNIVNGGPVNGDPDGNPDQIATHN